MDAMGNIVVGVDGSDGAAEALRWAIGEAALHGWTVTALANVSPPDDKDLDGAAAELHTHVVAAIGAEAAANVQERVRGGSAAFALVDTAHDADLLVVGARGLGGFKRLLLGSVSTQCLHYSTVPVAVTRSGHTAPGSRGRVVVGVDGSKTAERALRWAIDEAAVREAELEVVHGWQIQNIGMYPYPMGLDMTDYQAAADALVDEVLAAVEPDAARVKLTRTVRGGGAIPALLDASEQADLVIVGSRGMGGFKGMLLGSVAQAVAQHASCPVIVVPHERD